MFQCGMQVERGYVKAPRDFPECRLRSDWDWQRLLAALKPRSPLERELKRLVLREGFVLRGGSWELEPVLFSKANFPSMRQLRARLQAASKTHWAGLQLYYPMSEQDVKTSTGVDLVDSMMAVFREVTPAMNLCMQIHLQDRPAVRERA
jgi:hypothetical protein